MLLDELTHFTPSLTEIPAEFPYTISQHKSMAHSIDIVTLCAEFI